MIGSYVRCLAPYPGEMDSAPAIYKYLPVSISFAFSIHKVVLNPCPLTGGDVPGIHDQVALARATITVKEKKIAISKPEEFRVTDSLFCVACHRHFGGKLQ